MQQEVHFAELSHNSNEQYENSAWKRLDSESVSALKEVVVRIVTLVSGC